MTLTLTFAVLTALTSGVTEVIKRAFKAPAGVLPLTALIVGVLLTVLGNLTSLTEVTIIIGVAVGLSAAGLYDFVKYPINALKKK